MGGKEPAEVSRTLTGDEPNNRVGTLPALKMPCQSSVAMGVKTEDASHIQC